MVTGIMLVLCVSMAFGPVIYGADINYLRSTIVDHFSDTRNHEVNKVYKEQAKTFIYQEFNRYGLETEYHNFDSDISKTETFTNVIGIYKGANFGTVNDKIVGLCAHYDTVNNTKGVDDNGAGVATMLEVASQLRDQNKNGVKRSNTVVFVSFDLEEYGYAGSYAFITTWLVTWLAKNWGSSAGLLAPHGVIILDTMMEYNTSSHSQVVPDGADATFQKYFPVSYANMRSDSFRGDFLAMIYRAGPDATLASSLRGSWAAEKREKFEFESFPLPFADVSGLDDTVKNSYGNFLRSDHINFWEDNIPAIFLTDSANFRGDMVQCYHHPCDDLETMLTDDNINFLGKTADSIARSMNELSQPISGQLSLGLSCPAPTNAVPDTATCSESEARCDGNATSGYKCQCLNTHYDDNGVEVNGGSCLSKLSLGLSCPAPTNAVPDTATCSESEARCDGNATSGYKCQCLNTHYDDNGVEVNGGSCLSTTSGCNGLTSNLVILVLVCVMVYLGQNQ